MRCTLRPRPSPRPSDWAALWSVVIGVAAVAGCSADAAKEAVVSELAVGSWTCAPDAEGAGYQPFTVALGGDGTFAVEIEPDPTVDEAGDPARELSGTWSIEDGDLEWGFVDIPRTERIGVEDFDALTLDSTELTLTGTRIFEPDDGSDDPDDEQDLLVDAHGTDSLTLREPGGDPWTCTRE